MRVGFPVMLPIMLPVMFPVMFIMMLVSAHCAIAATDDCPRGARHLVTIPGVYGACAVAFDGESILVCAPEQVSDGSERQVVRALAVSGRAEPQLTFLPTGAGYAADIDVAADGTVAIADAAGSVRVIARDGSLRVIGEGTLESPSGVCWRGGELAVSDRRLRAVVVFSGEGVEIARVGLGQLGDPQGLAATADGSLFVADRLYDRIWHFAADTNRHLAGVGRALCEKGANPGQLRSPCDVAVLDRGGQRCLVVADELNHRIQILDGDGRFVGFFGMHALIPRQGAGRIHYPRSVVIDAKGKTIAVAEAFEDRVQVFALQSTANEIDASVGMSEFITSHFGSEVGCAADLLALLDVETQGVALLDARTTPPIHMAIIGGSGALPNRFGDVSAIAVEPVCGRVWIADSARARLDVFNTVWDRAKPPIVDMFIPQLARSMDLGAFVHRLTLPGGRTALRVPSIVDIAFDTRDPTRVLLLDAANRAIINTDLRLQSGTVDLLPIGARAPEELAIASDGRIAVADSVARVVFMRSAAGEWSTLARLGDIAFARPAGVGFDDTGALVVSDCARDACIVGGATVNASARLVGERGILDEQFFDPQAMVDSPNGLIVVDRGNHRFQRFGGGAGQFTWNLTGSMGRYYDRKRRGSPGAAPASTPEMRVPKLEES